MCSRWICLWFPPPSIALMLSALQCYILALFRLRAKCLPLVKWSITLSAPLCSPALLIISHWIRPNSDTVPRSHGYLVILTTAFPTGKELHCQLVYNEGTRFLSSGQGFCPPTSKRFPWIGCTFLWINNSLTTHKFTVCSFFTHTHTHTDQVLCLSPADVRKTLSRINPRKAAGPDNIPGCVLRDCAAQLTDVLTDIFNTSLSQAVVPTFLKSTSIIPVPKKSPVSCLNDYCPIALTPIMMKCFERLVMHHIKSSLPNTLDPFQFAYRPNRSTDDAISTTLHLALTHLEQKDSYVRMLFIDFSSAFNTIIPQQLILKLNLLGLNTSLCNWILDFLTARPQSVPVGRNTSSTTTLSTGAPQGCVLSQLLFTLLTHDCTAKSSSNHIIKFADDTTVVGLIRNNDETHREEVAQLAEWCGANNLSPNVGKKDKRGCDGLQEKLCWPPPTDHRRLNRRESRQH